MNLIVKTALNKILYEQPVYALSSLAGYLITNSKKSYPVFSRLYATPVYLQDNLSLETLKIDVELSYQGRVEVKHTHIFAYDESNQSSKHWCWDKPEENSGLETACAMVNRDINQLLDGICLTNSIEFDNLLDNFMHAN